MIATATASMHNPTDPERSGPSMRWGLSVFRSPAAVRAAFPRKPPSRGRSATAELTVPPLQSGALALSGLLRAWVGFSSCSKAGMIGSVQFIQREPYGPCPIGAEHVPSGGILRMLIGHYKLRREFSRRGCGRRRESLTDPSGFATCIPSEAVGFSEVYPTRNAAMQPQVPLLLR